MMNREKYYADIIGFIHKHIRANKILTRKVLDEFITESLGVKTPNYTLRQLTKMGYEIKQENVILSFKKKGYNKPRSGE